MSKIDIWMPLYIGDYLADTGRLTTLAHGAYLLLLMDYWRNGPLPDDDESLAAITRVTIQLWKRELKSPIRSFFTIGDDGRLHQKRIDIERAHALDLSEKRRIAGMKRAPRSAKPNGSNGMDPEHKTSSNSSSNSYSNSDHNCEYTRASRASALPSHSQLQTEREGRGEGARKRASPRTPLPPDWEPSEGGRKFAADRNADRPDVLSKFRDHHLARGSTMADWEAAWRLWCINEARFAERARPAPRRNGFLELIERDGFEHDESDSTAPENDVTRYLRLNGGGLYGAH